jgi:hypothetical protein
MRAIQIEKITPIRYKSKKQVKRESKLGTNIFDHLYNGKVNKIKGTSISPFVTFHPAR